MLTMKALYKDGQVFFLDEVPFTGECRVLVTFLDEELAEVFLTKDQIRWMVECVRNRRNPLSERQMQVLQLARDELTAKEIGEKLGIGYGSVRNHLADIYRLLAVNNRAEAVSKAIEFGLI